eukprot:SAG31_NODE_15049_length_773_cov_1.120178_1_plen_121_part_10
MSVQQQQQQPPPPVGKAQEDAPVPTCCFGGLLTPNTKILLVAMGLFSAITTAQVFAAIHSHSNALMADCVSMGVDALSYGVNAFSEAWPDNNRRRQEAKQLATSWVSYALLIYLTTSFMMW